MPYKNNSNISPTFILPSLPIIITPLNNSYIEYFIPYVFNNYLLIETPTTKVASPNPYGVTGGILE
ncbi:hypothetical protein E0M27_09130 [Bacillus mycoides]|nr:hypothetical protein E0M27_09130 [Bacillus mycoides]